jgi:hypothetical protein
MDKQSLKRAYKETPPPMGIYRVRNTVNGRSLVGSSLNVPAILNRHRSELKQGGHRNRELQREWNETGADVFEFETLDTLEPRTEPGFDAAGELRVLEELWLERLSPYGEQGYNVRRG